MKQLDQAVKVVYQVLKGSVGYMNHNMNGTSLKLKLQQDKAYDKRRLRMEKNRMEGSSLDTYINLEYMFKLKGYDFDVPSMYKTIYPRFKDVDKTLQCINSFLEDMIRVDKQYDDFLKYHKSLVDLDNGK